MPQGGPPTGKWASIPPHLQPAENKLDLRRARASLTVRRPGVPDVEIALESEEFVIGRQTSEVDLVIDDEWVSKRHARLTVDDRGYFKLEDLSSRNGIRYKGRSLRRLNLVDGDEFGIGKATFVFHAEMNRFEGTGEVDVQSADHERAQADEGRGRADDD